MKKSSLLIILVILVQGLFAQVLDPVLGPRAWKKENVGQKDAVELTHIREADVMWSTRVYRTIDLRQKQNLPLYFPMDSSSHGKRSLIQIIYDEFVANYDPSKVRIYEDVELRNEYSAQEVMTILTPGDSTKNVRANCDEYDTLVRKRFDDLKPEIVRVNLMEDWFFDKQRSVLDVRILALGIEVPNYAIFEDLDQTCQVVIFKGWTKRDETKPVWFYFPQLRPTFADLECYKRQNDATRLSYDDIFVQRIFDSYITKEENVYNRAIKDYTSGLDALLEAERIKLEIFNFEQELWEY